MCPASLLVGAERPIQHLDIASQKPHQVRLKGPTVAQPEEIGIVMLGLSSSQLMEEAISSRVQLVININRQSKFRVCTKASREEESRQSVSTVK